MDKNEKKKLLENYDFNLKDFALFLSVMKDKRAYKNVLEIIMNRENIVLKDIKVEEVVLNEQGKRAIRLDAWALDEEDIQYAIEMQNDTTTDFIPKRSRYYQGMLDAPILKSGKKTKYKHLPKTYIIFITEADIFGRDLACYTFENRCKEIPELMLEDDATKIFLNMTSKNGTKELVSLLQYMKHTTLENPEVIKKDKKLLELDRIVTEVKQSEEWEAVQMNILEIGEQKGREQGLKQGLEQGLEQGLKKGLTLGEEQVKKVNELNRKLAELNRVDDILKAATDKEYQQKLFEEFKI
ncbi:MAG: Rpn family recombination-promoting nuclease/putative transposase [Lachnospiraceae bacterium]|nr:Rpn family recombination-promoting nuclease/putative transposase [Lachnospiraceae bacterium]